MKNTIKLLLPILLIIFIGCKEEPNKLDTNIIINSTYKARIINVGNSVNVRYQIENIGEDHIRGWNIYFRVSMKSGKQVEAFDGRTYSLDSGEISEVLIANGKIPDHYDDDDVPIKASLQLMEAY